MPLLSGSRVDAFPPKKCGTTNNITKAVLFRERKSNTGKIGSIFYISSTKRGYYYFFFGLHFILRQKAAAIAIYITVLSCSMPIVKSYWFHCGSTKEIPTKLFVLWGTMCFGCHEYTTLLAAWRKSQHSQTRQKDEALKVMGWPKQRHGRVKMCKNQVFTPGVPSWLTPVKKHGIQCLVVHN